MHCDSLIGDEQRGQPHGRRSWNETANRLIGLMLISLDMYTARAVLHEPPRRILAPLPFSPVSISDYLFPGEGPADSLTSLADLLDLGALMEGDIQVTTNAVPLTTNAMPWARMCNRNRAFFFLCVTGLLGSCSRSERPAGIGKCFGNDRNQH